MQNIYNKPEKRKYFKITNRYIKIIPSCKKNKSCNFKLNSRKKVTDV